MNPVLAVEATLSLVTDDDIMVVGGAGVVHATFCANDRPRTLYLTGGEGRALAVAVGLAMTRFERVIALDHYSGIGAGMGVLALVGSPRPANLFHLALVETTAAPGGSRSAAGGLDLSGTAIAAGFTWARTCLAGVYGPMALEQWLQSSGPAFLEVAVENDAAVPPPFPMTREEIRDRFRAALAMR